MTLSSQLTEALDDTGSVVTEGRGWDGKKIGKFYRLQWSDATWSLEELPQKGGPRKVRHSDLQNPFWSLRGSGKADMFIPDNVLRDAKLDANDTYDQVKSKLLSVMQDAAKEYRDTVTSGSWVKVYDWSESSRGAVRVRPEGSDELKIKGKDFTMKSSFDKFEAFSPGSTMNYMPDGDPHYSVLQSKSEGGARKLYNLLKKDPEALLGVTWRDLSDWLKKNGIGYDYRQSYWG